MVTTSFSRVGPKLSAPTTGAQHQHSKVHVLSCLEPHPSTSTLVRGAAETPTSSPPAHDDETSSSRSVVSKDVVSPLVDRNGMPLLPLYSVDPLFHSLAICSPAFDMKTVDIVTDRSFLRKLLAFCNNRSTR